MYLDQPLILHNSSIRPITLKSLMETPLKSLYLYSIRYPLKYLEPIMVDTRCHQGI
nr:MAG TPA: hypothetical protein [Caudoviricetes sp.]